MKQILKNIPTIVMVGIMIAMPIIDTPSDETGLILCLCAEVMIFCLAVLSYMLAKDDF